MSTIADTVLQIVQESLDRDEKLSKKHSNIKSKTNQIFESKFVSQFITDSKSKCKKKKSK